MYHSICLVKVIAICVRLDFFISLSIYACMNINLNFVKYLISPLLSRSITVMWSCVHSITSISQFVHKFCLLIYTAISTRTHILSIFCFFPQTSLLLHLKNIQYINIPEEWKGLIEKYRGGCQKKSKKENVWFQSVFDSILHFQASFQLNFHQISSEVKTW